MRVAQDLYEGIELGDEGARGPHHVHAHRLDARGRERGAAGARLPAHGATARSTSPRAPQLYGDGKNKGKNAQDAHEAVRPTDPARRPKT